MIDLTHSLRDCIRHFPRDEIAYLILPAVGIWKAIDLIRGFIRRIRR